MRPQGKSRTRPFQHNSIGSANEIEFQAELSVKLGYCDRAETDMVLELLLQTLRMLIRLEAAIRKRDMGVRRHTAHPTPHSPRSQPR